MSNTRDITNTETFSEFNFLSVGTFKEGLIKNGHTKLVSGNNETLITNFVDGFPVGVRRYWNGDKTLGQG